MKYAVNDKVIDRSGFEWTIRKIVEWKGDHWYEVIRYDGRTHEAVRHESDLTLRSTAS